MNQWQNIGNDITNHLSIDDKKTLCGRKIGKIYIDGLNKVQMNVWVNNGSSINNNPICKGCEKSREKRCPGCRARSNCYDNGCLRKRGIKQWWMIDSEN